MKSLTQREKEVLLLICKGFTNEQVAKKLYLSKRTVETYRARVYKKTGVKNTSELVAWAFRNKMLE